MLLEVLQNCVFVDVVVDPVFRIWLRVGPRVAERTERFLIYRAASFTARYTPLRDLLPPLLFADLYATLAPLSMALVLA